jgi:hypothetical protein
MGYFDKFPSVYYDIKRNQNYQLVVDILRRVRINYKQVDTSLYGQYIIKEHDRPDTIAQKLYKDSNLHWVILLFNEIHNPYYEWPMKRQELLDYCETKYPGNAYLIELDKLSESPLLSVRRRRDHRVKTNDVVYQIANNNTVNFDGPRSTVICWDRTFSKAIVQENSGVFPDDSRICMIDPETNTATATGVLRRNQNNFEAVHHFIDNNGVELAPLGSYDALVQSGEKAQTTSTFDEYGRTAPLEYRNTLLGAYTSPNQEGQLIRVITNYEHEDQVNENRRTILLPHPNIVREITTQFENILNEGV